MRLISLSIAWVAGIYVGSLVSPPFYVLLAALIPCLLFAFLWRKKQALLWGGLCLIALLGGVGCYQWRVSEPNLQSFNDRGRVEEIIGKVERDPEFEGGFSRLSLSAQEIKVDSHWEKVSGKILIYTEVFSAYGQGDLLKVTGELHSLSQIENPDYRAYLSQQVFCSIMSYPEIESRQRGWLFSLMNRTQLIYLSPV